MYLDHELDVVRNAIAGVGAAVFVRLVANLQERVDLLLVHTHVPGNLRKSLVRLVACLMNDVRIEEGRLFIEQCLAEVPKLVGLGLKNGRASFMDEC